MTYTCNKYNDDRQYDSLIEMLLKGPYRIVDILPEQVPADAGRRYFTVEKYFLQPERIRNLRLRFAEILLRLNCYYEMAVSFDGSCSWEKDPDPEMFAVKLSCLSGNCGFRAVFEAQHAMIDIQPDDTYMTVYDPDSLITDRLSVLAAAEGLFVWIPPGSEN